MLTIDAKYGIIKRGSVKCKKKKKRMGNDGISYLRYTILYNVPTRRSILRFGGIYNVKDIYIDYLYKSPLERKLELPYISNSLILRY